MARTVTYKGYPIRAHAILVTDSADGEWWAQALIRVPRSDGSLEQPLRNLDDRTFPTQEDAEGYAVHIAMRRVDRHGA